MAAGATRRRRMAASQVTREKVVGELAQVAFAPIGETEDGGVKPGDKLKALELLTKQLGLETEAGERDNPFEGLTTEELRQLARTAGEGGEMDEG